MAGCRTDFSHISAGKEGTYERASKSPRSDSRNGDGKSVQKKIGKKDTSKKEGKEQKMKTK